MPIVYEGGKAGAPTYDYPKLVEVEIDGGSAPVIMVATAKRKDGYIELISLGIGGQQIGSFHRAGVQEVRDYHGTLTLKNR